jgi:hypothetical protein
LVIFAPKTKLPLDGTTVYDDADAILTSRLLVITVSPSDTDVLPVPPLAMGKVPVSTEPPPLIYIAPLFVTDVMPVPPEAIGRVPLVSVVVPEA